MVNHLRHEPKRTYTYKGLIPYGAGDLFVMDAYVDPDFSGNVPDEIMAHNDGVWNESEKTMTMPSGLKVYFTERR